MAAQTLVNRLHLGKLVFAQYKVRRLFLEKQVDQKEAQEYGSPVWSLNKKNIAGAPKKIALTPVD